MMKLNQYFKILLAISIIIFIFWNRLIRMRIPKELPLQLDLVTFLLYVTLIIILILFIFITLKLKATPIKKTEPWFSFILAKIYYEPLQSFETYLKSFKYVEDVMDKLQQPLIEKLSIDSKKCFKFYIILVLPKIILVLPKIILALVFLIETFILHKLNIFYKVLPLLMISLIARYFLYTLQSRFYEQCLLLNERLTIVCITPEQRGLSVNEYIHKTILSKLLPNTEDFNCIFGISPTYISKLTSKYSGTNTPTFDRQKALLRYTEVLQFMYSHYSILYLIEHFKEKYDSFINILVLSLYCFSWVYILSISATTNNYLELITLLSWLSPSSENPFI